jgi:hypothetical protein
MKRAPLVEGHGIPLGRVRLRRRYERRDRWVALFVFNEHPYRCSPDAQAPGQRPLDRH